MICFYVPGNLQNPLNGSLSRAHWRTKSEWVNRWKGATWATMISHGISGPDADRAKPKRVTFTARVARRWDDDNLPAGLKPVRDALMGRGHRDYLCLIHSDAPDSGHEFIYRQVVDQRRRGVDVTIEEIAP